MVFEMVAGGWRTLAARGPVAYPVAPDIFHGQRIPPSYVDVGVDSVLQLPLHLRVPQPFASVCKGCVLLILSSDRLLE